MDIEQLVTILNESGLLPYEIADAVYTNLEPSMRDDFDYGPLSEIENRLEIMQFYLAAKHLKD